MLISSFILSQGLLWYLLSSKERPFSFGKQEELITLPHVPRHVKMGQLFISNTDCLLVCLFSEEQRQITECQRRERDKRWRHRVIKKKKALRWDSYMKSKCLSRCGDRETQKQSDRQAGSCRLSAILTTDAHMLKPQHLSPLVLISWATTTLGVGDGYNCSFCACVVVIIQKEWMNLWWCSSSYQDFTPPVSDGFIKENQHNGSAMR